MPIQYRVVIDKEDRSIIDKIKKKCEGLSNTDYETIYYMCFLIGASELLDTPIDQLK